MKSTCGSPALCISASRTPNQQGRRDWQCKAKSQETNKDPMERRCGRDSFSPTILPGAACFFHSHLQEFLTVYKKHLISSTQNTDYLADKYAHVGSSGRWRVYPELQGLDKKHRKFFYGRLMRNPWAYTIAVIAELKGDIRP